MSHLKLFSFLSLIVPALSIIGIPLRDGHKSHFNFTINQFDYILNMDCKGDLLIIPSSSGGVQIHFSKVTPYNLVDIPEKWVQVTTKDQIFLPLLDGKFLEPKVTVKFRPIDPRIVVKLLRYANIPDNGKLSEPGWEVDDSSCIPTATFEDGYQSSRLTLYYNLFNCLNAHGNQNENITANQNFDDEITLHDRIIRLDFDKDQKLIKNIYYKYQKYKAGGQLMVNQVQINFLEFIKIN